jgi:DnaJ-domain-containing protein 1
MEDAILKGALEQGLWAVLFISLYLWELRENRRREDESRKREDRLMQFIEDISQQFENLNNRYEKLNSDVADIKAVIKGRRQ